MSKAWGVGTFFFTTHCFFVDIFSLNNIKNTIFNFLTDRQKDGQKDRQIDGQTDG